ncbi:hypothetical protein CCR83_05620 [Rhodobacter veldkampii DSM 11550]|uniref:DUF4177 domain-containing protein n=1 Tax=Phaeovulum veldkampii DSM 11550 TaxID=1185920 RepID=A0A2T4JM28_9RHOB|nr:DUF4177 domain-containing protein [Phaeovulum veldkampii]MBK5945944.1 hypothetical protein [Phaeovulum veldkampii DSM 11550]PTE18932.1 DUF4177 domain-containing protein [Phaeovulum veldkampii DSM 11550]TDQ64661.1 hypothetical protein EV658_101124 [Phaeovulum veldkampii DSM 11550]
MTAYDYKVIPAPPRAEKARGLKTAEDRHAHTLTLALNEMARDGWEYLRADVLPIEERSGLTSRSTVYHTLLVFRRPACAAVADPAPRGLTAEAPEGRAPRLAALTEPGAAPRLGPATGD